ncbi:hypothetical protein [Azospirillum palustre]
MLRPRHRRRVAESLETPRVPCPVAKQADGETSKFEIVFLL